MSNNQIKVRVGAENGIKILSSSIAPNFLRLLNDVNVLGVEEGSILIYNSNTEEWTATNNVLSVSPGITTISNKLVVGENLEVDGNVGIGTTNPQSTLHISGTSDPGIKIQSNDSGVTAEILAETNNFTLYTTSNHNIIVGTNNIGRVGFNNDGRIILGTIGTPTSSQTINVGTATSIHGAYISGSVGIGTTNPTSRLTVQGDVSVSGIITSTDYNSASDIKLKENIQIISNPIDKVLQLNGVTFTWKETSKSSMGVIAQEVEKVLPELVNGTDSKTVNYNGLIALLIECVKEQQNQLNSLKDRL